MKKGWQQELLFARQKYKSDWTSFGKNVWRESAWQLKGAQWLHKLRRCLIKKRVHEDPSVGANYYQNDDSKGKQQENFCDRLKQEISPNLSVKPQKGKRKKIGFELLDSEREIDQID